MTKTLKAGARSARKTHPIERHAGGRTVTASAEPLTDPVKEAHRDSAAASKAVATAGDEEWSWAEF